MVGMRSEVAVSERRACGLMEIHRGTYRYRPRPEDPRLRLRLRELAEQRRRFGYRRLQVLLVREGWEVNHKRVYRLYVEEKLSLRRKRGGRRRRAGAKSYCRLHRVSRTSSGPWTSPPTRSPVGGDSGP